MQPDPSFYIETPRLFLSHFIADNPKHCQFIAELRSSSDDAPMTQAEAISKGHDYITGRCNSLLSRHGYAPFLCSRKAPESNSLEDAIPVGAISLVRRDETQQKDEIFYTVPDVGFRIMPEERGKGYAAEGARAMVQYAFETLKLEGVLGFCSPTNMASQRTLERAGLEYRGERTLGAFKGDRSRCRVYALPGMKDLIAYGITDDV